MSPKIMNMQEDLPEPTTLHEAINIIKFLKSTHKEEINKLRESYSKQSEKMKKLEQHRKKELEFLSTELQKYELNLSLRTETVARQLAEKDDIIMNHIKIIEDLNAELEALKSATKETLSPEINVLAVDSNSDSGIAMDNDESKTEMEFKVEPKTRKCRRFAESISFLRRVDFSPMKYKPNQSKKKEENRKNSLDLPLNNQRIVRQRSSTLTSDDDRSLECVLSDNGEESIIIKPKKMDESMTNHFSDEGSDDSEEVFDRVMTRSSVRRSVKANPKYKKISRTKSKLLEQVKVGIMD